MLRPLLLIDLRRLLRNPYLLRNAITIFLVLVSLFLIALPYILMGKLSNIKEILEQLPLEQMSLFIICIFAASDMMLKIFLMRHLPLYKPDFIRSRPIHKWTWRKYELSHDMLSGWTLYQLILFVPFCFTYFSTFGAVLVVLLSYFAALLNRLVIKLFSRSYALVKILTIVFYIVFIVSFFYVPAIVGYGETLLLGCTIMYLSLCILVQCLYWRTNEYADFSITIYRAKQSYKFSYLKMEFVSIWRSKWQRTILFTALFMGVLMAIQIPLSFKIQSNNPVITQSMWILLATSYTALMFQVSYFIGIEANYFCGILSKPILFKELLQRKFVFCFVLTLLGSLSIIPSIVLGLVSLLKYVASIMYCAGFFNQFCFITMFSTNRLNINESGFMNFQGWNVIVVTVSVTAGIISFGIYLLAFALLDEVAACLSLLGIGISGILLRYLYFKLLYRIFKTKRYRMTERFINS